MHTASTSVVPVSQSTRQCACGPGEIRRRLHGRVTECGTVWPFGELKVSYVTSLSHHSKTHKACRSGRTGCPPSSPLPAFVCSTWSVAIYRMRMPSLLLYSIAAVGSLVWASPQAMVNGMMTDPAASRQIPILHGMRPGSLARIPVLIIYRPKTAPQRA